MDMTEKLERMYHKVTRGKRSLPHLEATPKPIGAIMVNGVERGVYPTTPPIICPNGERAYACLTHLTSA